MSIRTISSTGIHAWRPCPVIPESRTTDDGDLILSVADLYESDAENVIVDWAAAAGFSLQGISAGRALWGLLVATIGKALADVPHDAPLVLAMRAVGRGGATSLLPEFSVVVDGCFAVAHLVETYDGPFEEADELVRAIDRRLDENSPLRRE
ncbi:hypothetical protein [Microbacterium sp. P04]|uniref:hypothetical protein n=1 Tax=Microbacterium sp. P04 TaxID=3366947 RepID=UPI003744E313